MEEFRLGDHNPRASPLATASPHLTVPSTNKANTQSSPKSTTCLKTSSHMVAEILFEHEQITSRAVQIQISENQNFNGCEFLSSAWWGSYFSCVASVIVHDKSGRKGRVHVERV